MSASSSDIVPFWLAGEAATSDRTFEVHHPHDGSLVAVVAEPTPEQTERAVAAAHAVRATAAATPAHVRAAALNYVADQLTARSEEVARLITAENGKPVKWARLEVARGISTFRWAAEEARRFSGELQRLDTDPSATGRIAVTRRFPRGAVLGISPFNFPLNLVAHKIAPAIAVGAPIILKPAPKTPLAALLLGEILAGTDLPAGSVSVLPVPNERAGDLVADPRLPVVSFTGSGPVGWSIKDAVPRKHVTLELGGNAAVVVCSDYPDLDWAATRIATFSNYQGGQSCIAVQRVLVARDRYHEFVPLLVDTVKAQVTGDPSDDKTDVGPLIDVAAAERVESWVDEAVGQGAELLTGGVRDNASYAPTVLAGVPADATVNREEVFGPVLTVTPFDTVDDAFALVNDSQFGLQAGVFTRDIQTAFAAQRVLEVGGVIVGDVPSYRADQMPYGGVKASGVGREGLRSAMTDYTEERVMVLTGVDL
ncbi:aldehyde dehydrogenase family protein [Cryptosporangium aurantiacum]|uniref:Succinate semialdehyde dehydrogenase n=1 Tax=Cryptosporangium aurantiacum TaxID=134849 RepID=A0A1M7MYX4_9ACTN|nr:aldehyde dehydrogenase family protein [Cryptosporangium aurantiacum]SHM96278.1 succinate semialdehyde dehydrogenase [Cryptosporangium aurantiacum]